MANIGSLIAHLGVDTSGLRSAAKDFKQFETTTSSGLSSMTKGVVALAAAFASLKLVQGGKDAVMFAASVEQADVALRSISNSMGMAADKAIKYRDSLRDVNITTSSATNATAQFIRMGLPIEKLNQLGTAAQGAAINYKMMTGETISSSEALDKMVHAIATGQNIVLHNLGIMTNMKDIYRENRQETGLASSAVDSHKRHLLVLDDVLEKTVPLMNLYKDSTGLATKNISSSKRPLEEMKLALGNLFLPELTAASLAFYNTVSSGQKWIRSHGDELRTATGMIKDFSEGMLYAAGVLGIYATAMGAASLANGGFAATTGLFTGLLSTMRMQLSLTGATATVMATQINAMGVSVATAMQVATVSVLSLKAAIGVLSGFMIGWEIGKWWSTFESGAKAGVAVVHAMVKAWDWVSEAAERAWIVMKGSATTWTGVMGALDAIGKKYEALAVQRAAAFGESWDAAKGKPVAGPAAKEWKEDPAVIAANAARIAAEQAEAAALAGAQAAKKLAEQWAKTKRGLEQELKLEGLTGLEKTLQEITNRADELRATAGTDKAWVKQWEEQTKAAATYRDEIERLGKQYEVFAENQLELKRIKEDYDALVIDMLPAEGRAVALVAEEYKKKRLIIEEAMASGQASAESAAQSMAALAVAEAEANDAALKSLRDKSDTTKDIWKNMYQSLQSITADWLENMKISWASLGTLFKKFVAQMVSAWAWGQASMAFASPAMGGAGGAGGPTGLGGSSIGGLSSLFSPSSMSGTFQEWGVTGLSSVAQYANEWGFGAVSDIAVDATNWLGSLSAGLADGLMAGVGSLAVSLISGKGLTVQTGFQAAGAALGSYLLPGIGTVLGGIAGNFIGGLFGSGGGPSVGGSAWSTGESYLPASHTSHQSDAEMGQAAVALASTISRLTAELGGASANLQAMIGFSTDPEGDSPSSVMGGVRDASGKQLYLYGHQDVGRDPESMRAALDLEAKRVILAALQVTDLNAFVDPILDALDLKTISADAADKALAFVEAADQIIAAFGALGVSAEGLASGVFDASKAGELISGDVWAVLADSAQQAVRDGLAQSAKAFKDGDLAAGQGQLEGIVTAVSQISSAFAPIQEIIDTNGLTEYELSLRSINQQFDQYAAALQAAGVDLAKYTQLEEARAIALAKVARETLLADAAADLRTAYDAEQNTIAATHETLLAGLNDQLKIAQEASTKLTGIMGKLRSTLDRMSLNSNGFALDQRTTAQATLQAVLVAARNGDLSGTENLDQPLDVLSGASEGLFASFEDYQRDFWRTYLSIAELEQISGDQLSVQDQTVSLLEQQISDENSRFQVQTALLNAQLNALLQINESVLSIDVATAQYKQAEKAGTAAGITDDAIRTYVNNAIATYGANDTAALDVYNAAVGSGISASRLASVMSEQFGWTTESVNNWAAEQGLPSFAVGTSYVPGDMVAKIHQGEEITPRPYVDAQREDRRESNKLLGEVVAENKQLRADINKLMFQLTVWQKRAADSLDNIENNGITVAA